jgi:GT2 family glycosyltransferase
LAAIRGSGANVAEHIVVIGDECNASLRNTLVNDPTLHVVSDTAPFNFARRSNRGSQAASGEILVFVNDDFVPIRSDWLELLTAPLADERVAITGGTLLFEDNSVQHLGVGIIAGSDRHFYSGTNMSIPRVASLVAMNREVDAVTGACLAVRADVFNDVGGLFEGFPLNYNDIDLCLKLRQAGFRIVYSPHVRATHWESRTRRVKETAKDVYLARWAHFFANDPFYSPHLSPIEFAPDPLEHLWRDRKVVALAALASRHPRTRASRGGPADPADFSVKNGRPAGR